MNNTNKNNYLHFEHYCVNKHYLDFNQKTYHWSLIPDTVLIDSGYFENEELLRERRKKNKGILKEYGLDAISIENLNDTVIYHGIQVKLWNETICAKHLGTFTSVIINRFSNNSKGYLYYTSQLENTFENDIKRKNKFIAIKVDNPYHENNKSKDIYNKIILRDYQIEAVNKLNTNWNGIKTLILPCGTGKTIVFSEYLKQNKFQNIFIFSPLTVLTEQNLEKVSNYLINYKPLLIDVNGTRDFKDIENNLHKNYIFSSTFCSAKSIVSQLFLKDHNLNSDNTILIIDEAHNLLNQTEFIEIINKFPKVLLVTATLPIQMEDIMPNEIIYNYPFKKAIENKYICDYEIYLPFFENGEINIKIPSELYEFISLEKDIYKKCLFFINGLLRTGKRCSIIYLSSKEECELYNFVLKEIMEKYHFYDILIYEITSNTSKKDRTEILNDFEKEENYEVLKVILSIRILDEGIDIVKCDSIFITYISDYNNDIRYLQRICRANRFDPNNIHKKASIFMWCDDKNKILHTLQMLKINDINLNKKIKVYNSNYGTYKKGTIIKDIELNNEIVDFININCLTEEELWEKKKELLFEFCNLNSRCINKNENYKNYNIGNWYYSQKIKIFNNIELYNNLLDKLVCNHYVKENLQKNKLCKKYLNYKCLKCSYKCKLFNDITRHLQRSISCHKNLDAYNYSDEILLKLSLIPYNNDKQEIDNTILKKNNKFKISKKKLFEILDDIEKKKLRNCPLCSINFNKKYELKKHIILDCINIDFEIKDNNDNIQNLNNYIHVHINCPISFEENWNSSHLSTKEKIILIINMYKYTKTLESLLKNKNNHNVIIDRESKTGLVYNNHNIKLMTLDQICNKSIDKINYHLNQFIDEVIKDNSYSIDLYYINDSKKKLVLNTKITNIIRNIEIISIKC